MYFEPLDKVSSLTSRDQAAPSGRSVSCPTGQCCHIALETALPCAVPVVVLHIIKINVKLCYWFYQLNFYSNKTNKQ